MAERGITDYSIQYEKSEQRHQSKTRLEDETAGRTAVTGRGRSQLPSYLWDVSALSTGKLRTVVLVLGGKPKFCIF